MSIPAPVKAKVKVLIVDDSEDQRTLLRRYFERAGCEVAVAASAEEAILTYSRRTPELAVIDLMLPGMNGWDLTERMKADRPECMIVVSSVLDKSQYPASDAVLPKPFTGAQVRKVLRDLVPRWSAE
ncbi:MAG TPA: response regulator [Microbacteriaceae bacterium]|jgi:CheY-like chemotaxis protein|nr:response regulator [Microbacteriaceae bacterium]